MEAEPVSTPSHIPPELVRDFDFANVAGAEDDAHLAWKRLHEGPDIFWTPHYGGHWVATRAALIEQIQTDHEAFSHRIFSLPQVSRPFRFLPLEVDPPEHAAYRRLISPVFSPAAVTKLENTARTLAIDLIEGFRPRGRCEFVADFARHLPVIVFLGMMNLPLTDRERFIEWGEVAVRGANPQVKAKAFKDALDYVSRYIAERTKHPGSDIISRVAGSEVNGNPLRPDEVLGIVMLLFFGGLDTVASMMGFIARFLACNPAHRRQLVAEPTLIPAAIEELLRRHGLSNTVRVLTRDTNIGDVLLRKDDVIMVPISLHGMDERQYVDPLTVDFKRKPVHATFGNGPHKCPGANLARTEIRIFLQEWLPRIPDFEIPQGESARTATGSVNGVTYLPLTWAA